MRKKNTILLKFWGLLLIAGALIMGSTPIFAFGAVGFGALSFLWIQDVRKRGVSRGALLSGALLFLSFFWFIVNILLDLAMLVDAWDENYMAAFMMAIAFLFPPLIMTSFYCEVPAQSPTIRKYRLILPFAYVVSVSCGLYVLALLAGLAPYSGPQIFQYLGLTLGALFASSGIYGGLAMRLRKPPQQQEEREHRRWNYILLASMVVIFVALVFSSRTGLGQLSSFLSVFARSLPIIFLFFNSYYESRFEFFDVFVKKSTLFFLTAIVLAVFFTLTRDLLFQPEFSSMKIWVAAMVLAPLVLFLHWMYRNLEGWLDRVWLGRKFGTDEGVKFFAEGVQGATSPEEFVSESERRLSTIYQAPVRIQLAKGDDPELPFEPALRVPTRACLGDGGGEILMGPRVNQTPYFSQDITLLTALADVFSFMLGYVRLQQKKQEQEKREQDLILHASRSELKALRAQIHPHFLFNALNAIAGLIHGNPERAEATVEELAEVFRYTLRSSEKEWVKISEEMDFVRSYLEVERSRFGKRLEVSVQVQPEVRDLLIPTMMVQTLVENAVKHGVSAVRGVGRIRIDACREDDRVVVEVADNGFGPESCRPAALESGRKGEGYGLRNIRERLQGYCGQAAGFELRRDEARSETIARIWLPAHRREDFQRARGA
ncbi:MAG TPA: sensor histidine kinase [Acidobacteriota bacterium]|nr:sensor histidine kinase [Acidobacteriota bacterium]